MFNKKESITRIVIDIGGSSFRCSVIDSNNNLINHTIMRFQSPNFIRHPKESISSLQKRLIESILRIVLNYRKKFMDIKTVGISFPGPITQSNLIIQAPTLWGEEGRNFNLIDKLKQIEPHLIWLIANDITAAAERYGNQQKYQKYDFLGVITISSGVGNKIYDIQNKRVILDNDGFGGELGHVKINYSSNAEKCDCGEYGHIGAYSSGRAIERLVKKELLTYPGKFFQSYLSKLKDNAKLIDNYDIVKAIHNNDQLTNMILDQSTFPIAQAISYFALGIGVKKFVVIGGFAVNCGEFYRQSLLKNLIKIGIRNISNEDIDNMIDIGFEDDNDPLIGMGFLIQKIM